MIHCWINTSIENQSALIRNRAFEQQITEYTAKAQHGITPLVCGIGNRCLHTNELSGDRCISSAHGGCFHMRFVCLTLHYIREVFTGCDDIPEQLIKLWWYSGSPSGSRIFFILGGGGWSRKRNANIDKATEKHIVTFWWHFQWI